uniref:Uncharacterized protein n=1 Tax=Arundo donax TaxID=35708 RepID=A0A0A8YJ08_ARUDO
MYRVRPYGKIFVMCVTTKKDSSEPFRVITNRWSSGQGAHMIATVSNNSVNTKILALK